ncbi:MAG: hypothetical protein COB02_04395 [Candidatus Cloacimonadota bacterium]|nr:MAG: hypothetical protein COB02_04395 [Candidatus Cloacimonadota bacterium]
MPIFTNLTIKPSDSLEQIILNLDPQMKSFRVLKKSVDARKKSNISLVYTIETFESDEVPKFEYQSLESIKLNKPSKIGIVGAGPAGMFAALRLIERGTSCILFERGKRVQERMKDIARFWRYGELLPDSNVCYGEGGAGTFSDGKLITRIKSPYIQWVKEQLVRFGAPEEILYLSNPHVGSNKIRQVIAKLHEYLANNGCQLNFQCKINQIKTKNNQIISVIDREKNEYNLDYLILATGHSAKEMYYHLNDINVTLEPKSFALGVRVEHTQKWVDQTQYGNLWDHENLPTANYKLADHNHETGIGVYSFCMCPGGFILKSNTESDTLCVNGMSNYQRGSKHANAAIVVSIDHTKWFANDLFGGIKLQEKIEKKALQWVIDQKQPLGVPAQRMTDYLSYRLGNLPKETSSISPLVAANFHEIFPKEINDSLVKSLKVFQKKMKGFCNHDAVMVGVETRTSSPLRIVRDNKTLFSTSHNNLYPCGEGAGYAGGITSAAVDGVKIVEKILETINQL